MERMVCFKRVNEGKTDNLLCGYFWILCVLRTVVSGEMFVLVGSF